MIAEIIAVGSELVSGQRLDTNSAWLSAELGRIGITVRFHTTVGDDHADNVAAFRTAVGRADLVVVTGGLGPTQDDLTRDVLAELAGAELVLHEPSLEHMARLFERRGLQMPERNRVQALFPKGSEPLENPIGTAPGIWLVVDRGLGDAGVAAWRSRVAPSQAVVVALPGVPSEMKRMFAAQVVPRLRACGLAGRTIVHRRINLFGLGESAAEAKLMDLTRRGRRPEVGITVHEATITLRIAAEGADETEARRRIEPTAAIIYERLGDYIFGEEDEELEDAVARLLVLRGRTLATVESGTGGLVSHRLTNVPGITRSYRGGLIVPTDEAKHSLLGIDRTLLELTGPASREVAGALALACRERFATDLALAVTEWPPLAGAREGADVGGSGGDATRDSMEPPRLFLALASFHGLQVEEHRVAGDPTIVKSRSAKLALDLVRRTL